MQGLLFNTAVECIRPDVTIVPCYSQQSSPHVCWQPLYLLCQLLHHCSYMLGQHSKAQLVQAGDLVHPDLLLLLLWLLLKRCGYLWP